MARFGSATGARHPAGSTMLVYMQITPPCVVLSEAISDCGIELLERESPTLRDDPIQKRKGAARSRISFGIPIAFRCKCYFFLGKPTKLVRRSLPGFHSVHHHEGFTSQNFDYGAIVIGFLFLTSPRRAFAQDDVLFSTRSDLPLPRSSHPLPRSFLHVKSKENDVAVLHDIFFAFAAEHTCFASGVHRTVFF